MASECYLGEFEFMTLLGLLRLDEQAYGALVRRELEARTGRDVSIGAVYATLNRLEAKGLVRSSFGDPTPERGGRSKRYFRVTRTGLAAVRRTHEATQRMLEGLDMIRSAG